ncbi:MAG: hypothetical protein ACRC22_02095, partial [Shewanella sp.]
QSHVAAKITQGQSADVNHTDNLAIGADNVSEIGECALKGCSRHQGPPYEPPLALDAHIPGA